MAAKTDLVPIKIKLCMKMVDNEKRIDYPALNNLSSNTRKGLGWSVYVDIYGIGLHYDKVENLGTGADCGYACTCVPKDFADAAANKYSLLISIISEAEFEKFYNERSHVYEPENIINHERLMGLKAAIDLGALQANAPEVTKALDPTDRCAGICKNMNKTWADCKSCYKGLTFHASVAKP